MKIFDITNSKNPSKSYNSAFRFLDLAVKYNLRTLVIDQGNFLKFTHKPHSFKIVRYDGELDTGYIPQVIIILDTLKTSATILNYVAATIALHNPVVYVFEGKSSVAIP